jgi:putative ABC transport system ATP-binding protein
VAEGITLENVVKTYGSGETAVHALRGVDMAVAKGEVVGLIGPSGRARVPAQMPWGGDRADIRQDDDRRPVHLRQWLESPRSARAAPRYDRLHFSGPYLIPFLDVTDNVALLPMLAGKPNAEARKLARDLLDALDVGHRAAAMPRSFRAGSSNAWQLPAP